MKGGGRLRGQAANQPSSTSQKNSIPNSGKGPYPRLQGDKRREKPQTLRASVKEGETGNRMGLLGKVNKRRTTYCSGCPSEGTTPSGREGGEAKVGYLDFQEKGRHREKKKNTVLEKEDSQRRRVVQ